MLLKFITNIQCMAYDFVKDKRGVTAVEYAIIAVVMSALVLAAFQNETLKNAISGALTKVTTNLTTATNGKG